MSEAIEDGIGTTRWLLLCALTDLSTAASEALREFVVSDGEAAMVGNLADLRSCIAKIAEQVSR